MIDLSVDQARKIIAVAPKDSPYYQESQRVLFAKGYVSTPMRGESTPIRVESDVSPSHS